MTIVFVQEVRIAVRSLLRSPGFSLTAIGMLGAGLGLCLFMFAVIQSHLLRPLPFANGEQLLHVGYVDTQTGNRWIQVPLQDFRAMREADTGFASLHAFSQGDVNLSGGMIPERLQAAWISAGSFRDLGVLPQLGRELVASDEAADAPLAVVIGYALWQEHFDARSDVLGSEIKIDGEPATVVGVMPEEFAFPFNNRIWLAQRTSNDVVAREAQTSVDVWGRLAPGTGMAGANAALSTLLQELNAQSGGAALADAVRVDPYMEYFAGPMRPMLATMFTAVILVLIIACANVAQLLLARNLQRARESAIRTAIGASRRRLMLSNLVETLLVCLAASVAGLLLAMVGAHWAMQFLRAAEYPPPYWMTNIRLDGLTVAFTLSMALLGTLLAGLWPAWRAARIDVVAGMRGGGSVLRSRSGSVLAALEIALCMVCLVAAALTLQSVLHRGETNLPVAAEKVLSGRLSPLPQAYPDDASLVKLSETLKRSLAAIPGIETAGISTSVPYSWAGSGEIEVEGRLAPADGAWPSVQTVAADPGYFASLQLTAQQGRLIDSRDTSQSPAVAVISQSLAERFWPGEVAIGKRLRMTEHAQDAWIEVVGIVPQLSQDADDRSQPSLYRPFAQAPRRQFSFVLRSSGPAAEQVQAVREAVFAIDPELPIYYLRSVRDWLDVSAHMPRVMASLFGMFGLFALLLAAAGLYAVLAFQISQRSREIGLRRALGARRGNILGMLLRQSLTPLLLGISLGLFLAFGFAQVLASVLLDIETGSVLLFALVAIIISTVAAVAALLPARRALAVSPLAALRWE